MYSVINNVEKLVSSVSDIAETKIALIKLKAAGKISTSLSTLVFFLIIGLFGSLALTIMSFGFAYFIGSELNNISYGFFIIGGFYVLTGLLVFINRKKWIQAPINNLIINKLIQL